PEERLEALEDWVGRLRRDCEAKPVLVEGRRDRAALARLGCEGGVIVFNDGASLIDTADRISREHAAIILLLDWDRTGGSIHRRMKEALEALGVRCDERYRKELAVLVSKETKSLEGVPGYLSRLRALVGGRG
ncbi:MAG: hypothetical protein ACRDH5_14910, partial [bacterium]